MENHHPIRSLADIETVSAPEFVDWSDELFPGFERFERQGVGATIRGVKGGQGPALMLIHGNPLTHASWHKIAPSLARHFTIIAPDLRGYGDSDKPEGGADHSGYSFRSMSEDLVAVARSFGIERMAVVGHDRGGRVGFRMSLDHPDLVSHLVPLDIAPTHHVLTNVSLGWGLEAYHWFFMAQKYPFPEKLLCADLNYYIQYKLNKKGVGLEIFSPQAMAEYVRCTTPEQIHAVCEDYRATVSVDLAMDTADFGNKKIQCPVMVLWGSNSHCGRHFKPLQAWSDWADRLEGCDIPTGHYPAEQNPQLVYKALWSFLNR
ncbi:MAG: alpha/beta fold hydrolase [Burkholderiaceae bacterium]